MTALPQKGKARFDIGHLSPRALTYKGVSKSAQRRERPAMSCDALCDVMISSRDWLKIYGLSANKLSMEQIMPSNGFEHRSSFDDAVKKNVCSKYAEGYFEQYIQKDGKVFNLLGDSQKMQQYVQQLNAAIAVYKARMEWLTTGSRKLFGVVHEKCVTVIIDVHTYDDTRYQQYIDALIEVCNDQIAKIEKFNLVQAGQDVKCFRDYFVDVNNASINEATEWIRNLDRYSLNTNTSVVEAISKAFRFPQPSNFKHGVYLFTENGATDGARHILKSKLAIIGRPLNAVSYNSTDSDTISFLKELSLVNPGGRFHAYAITETDVDSLTGQVSYYGGTPPGAGMPEELMLIWNELETARDTVDQLEHVIKTMEKQKSDKRATLASGKSSDSGFTSGSSVGSLASSEKASKRHLDMQYMDSKTWLLQNGMNARGLEFYTFLGNVAFRHCDGVVKNLDKERDSSPDSRKKLINAKYCEDFVHVLWKDGHVRHVQVTGRMFRDYETRMNSMLKTIQTRISWLCQGSRELFGAVCENKVYILIDTSASMESRLKMVKEKLFQLMQEQLRHKVMFNIVAFDSHVKPWRDALVNVTEANLRLAWDWVRDIETGGSTNTMGALKQSLGDANTEAVYLLSDGRPDHLPKSIYAQACLHPRIPIHTISFNCHDREANVFLKELANISGGRFHIFYDSRTPQDFPQGFQSEDLTLLRQEYDTGKQSMKLVAKLRAECATMEWSRPELKSLDGGRGGGNLSTRSNRSFNDSFTGSVTGTRSKARTPRSYRIIDPEQEMASAGLENSPRLELMRKTVETMKHYTSTEKTSAFNSGISSARSIASEYEVPGDSKAGWILEETQKLFERQKMKRDEALKVADNFLNQAQSVKSPRKKARNRFYDSQDSLKEWLKVNSLVAKRLTIIDALSKTIITQKPMFVPSIDKVVLSKVFDEILPISYATTRQKNEIHLVNPQAVDLKSYESRLTEMIQTYYRKIDFHVWQKLPYMEKQGYNNIPPNWETDRGAILESLQRCNWPVSREELQLIDDEIELGKKFLQQSIDLRLCARNTSPERPKRALKISPSPRQTPRRLVRPQSARRPITGNRKTLATREEVTAKVELSQDEINLVQLYRDKVKSGMITQRDQTQNDSSKFRRKVQAPVGEEKVSRHVYHSDENKRANSAAVKSAKLETERKDDEKENGPSGSYTSYSSSDWPSERSDSQSKSRGSKSDTIQNDSKEETGAENPLLRNILKEAGVNNESNSEEKQGEKTPNNREGISVESSSAVAHGTGLDAEDEDDSFFE